MRHAVCMDKIKFCEFDKPRNSLQFIQLMNKNVIVKVRKLLTCNRFISAQF